MLLVQDPTLSTTVPGKRQGAINRYWKQGDQLACGLQGDVCVHCGVWTPGLVCLHLCCKVYKKPPEVDLLPTHKTSIIA